MPRKVLYELEDLWEMADKAGKAARVMSLEEMNQAKAKSFARGKKKIITLDDKFASDYLVASAGPNR